MLVCDDVNDHDLLAAVNMAEASSPATHAAPAEGPATEPAHDASNFSAALASWRDINLGELQKTLDSQGPVLRA